MIIRPTLPETPNYTTPRGTIIGARTGLEPGPSACSADRPTGLRLMTGETGTPISPQILEKRVASRSCATVGLESRDLPAGIRIDTELWNFVRRRLRTLVGIFETAHLLCVADRAGRPI
jgi:hypothetical protein